MLSAPELEALRLSLKVATWATLGSLPLAIAAAWILGRLRFPGRALLDAIVHMSLVLPPVAVGYVLLVTLGARAPLGHWLEATLGIHLIFTAQGAAVAAAVMSFPLMVRAIRLSLDAVDPGLEAAARTLGAGRFDTFRSVTLPLMLPGILSGCVIAFASALGEFGATITFVSNIEGETRTLAARHLHRDTDRRRRRRGYATGRHRVRPRLRAAGPVRMDRAACRAAGDRPMNEHARLEVALSHRVGEFALDVAFEVPARGVTALFGASGAGKTTIVNAIAGLLRPQRGHVRIGGTALLDTARAVDVPIEHRGVGYVFQDARLFPHLSVDGNLRFGERRTRGRPRTITHDEVVALLGIGHLLERRPGALSGGERQRVALGRALLAQPRLLLLDEPLASLDGARRAEILPYLERLRDEVGLPIVYVSHAIDEVVRLATRVVVLAEGRVVATGTVEDVFSRAEMRPHVGRRFEGGTILAAAVTGHDDRLTLSTLALGAHTLTVPRVNVAVGTMMRIRILARDVALARSDPEQISIGNRWPGRVAEIVERDGPYVEVRVDLDGPAVWALVTRASVERLALAPGVPVWCLVKTVALDARTLGFAEQPQPRLAS